MRRRAIGKRPEPAQKVELLCPEAGDFHEALGPRQDRQQAQQQHLIKRVDHLATLPRVRQRPEMIQKNNRFAQSTRRVHHATSLPNRWRSMESEPYSVVTHSFTRLPWPLGVRSMYLKVRDRTSYAYALTSAAVALTQDAEGRIDHIRVA